MKKYKVITQGTINKIATCFTDKNEIVEFVQAMDFLAEELVFSRQYRERSSNEESTMQLAVQIIAFTDFCRERMDMLNQLVGSLSFEEMTEEEIKRMERDRG